MSTTVALILGPYRNLSTMTCAALFMNQRCQILNHQASQIFDEPSLDFIKFPTTDKVAKFISKATHLAADEGSILESHAFEPGLEPLTIFKKSELSRNRLDIDCLIWKESLRLTNILKSDAKKIDTLNGLGNIKFLMPIRFPLDCAKSNLVNGHVNIFGGLYNKSNLFEVVSHIFDLIIWFEKVSANNPHSFMRFFEHQISLKLLREISLFLDLTQEQDWHDLANKIFKPRSSSYVHSEDEKRLYINLVKRKFDPYPTLKEEMLAFRQI